MNEIRKESDNDSDRQLKTKKISWLKIQTKEIQIYQKAMAPVFINVESKLTDLNAVADCRIITDPKNKNLNN